MRTRPCLNFIRDSHTKHARGRGNDSGALGPGGVHSSHTYHHIVTEQAKAVAAKAHPWVPVLPSFHERK
jgi:hypothetical protein